MDKNFRVPVKIVDLVTSIYCKVDPSGGINTSIYSPKNITSSEKVGVIPEIIQLENYMDQMNWLASFLMNDTNYCNIGILFKVNDQQKNGYFINRSIYIEHLPGILETFEFLTKSGIKCGYKYRSNDKLSFSNERNINLLTIHSAKGLEFDCVIIPFYSFSNVNTNPSLPYVAFTRCNQKLVILYSGIVSQDLERAQTKFISGNIRKHTENDQINPLWIIEKEKYKSEYSEYQRISKELDNLY